MVLAVAVSFIDVPSNSDIGRDFPTKYLPTCPTPSSSSSSRTPSSLSSSKLSLSLLSKEHGHDYLVMFLSRLEMFFSSSPFFVPTHGNEKSNSKLLLSRTHAEVESKLSFINLLKGSSNRFSLRF